MSKVGKGCHWEQHSKEEKTPKCPLADRVVSWSNIQKRKQGHRDVQDWIRLSLGETFRRGKDTGGCHGLCSTCYSPWRPAVDGLLLSAWIVNPMAMAPETTIYVIGKDD
jgi:hypothetical protein